MDNTKTKENEKNKIRENHDMGFHKVMKFGLMELITVGVGWSLFKLFDIKSQYGGSISSPLSLLTTLGSVLEIIMLLLAVTAIIGFFMNKRFCVPAVNVFFILLTADRLFSFIMISICDEASLVKTDEFLPSYALWNLRLTFFALIFAIIVIKYYSERKKMFN